MRPLELTVEGFRSYRGRTTFDWRGRRLVGIVGPIGSGKSSVLDAVSFALYGKTPSVERDTRSLIHQQLDQCHVELRFSAHGQVWRAVRGLRRRGQSGHQLDLLAADEPDAERLETVTGEAAVNQRVAAALGMDFKTFCRSVLLAQNRFAEFLTAKPAERDQVLKGVFGFERLDRAHEVAKDRAADARRDVDALSGDLGRIEEARDLLPAAREAEEVASRRVAQLEAIAPEVERLGEVVRAGRRATADAVTWIAEVRQLTAGLPAVTDIDRLAAEANQAETEVRDAATAATEAEGRRTRAEAEVADVEEQAGGRERLDRAGILIGQREQQVLLAEERRDRAEAAERDLIAVRADADAARAAEKSAGTEVASAAEVLSASRARVAEAEAALEAARHDEMAAALQHDLVRGEPCPVCAQPVAVLPKGARAARATAASKALERARAGEERRRAAAEAARSAAAVLQEKVAASQEARAAARRGAKEATASLAAAERDLHRADRALSELLGPGDPVEELSSRRKAVAVARDILTDAARAARAAATARDAARERAERLRGDVADLAAGLSGAWGRLGESRTIDRTPDAVRAAFSEVGTRLLDLHREAVEAREAAATAEAEAAAALDSLQREAGVSRERGFGAAVTEAATAKGTATAKVEDLGRILAGRRGVAAKMRKAERRRDLAERLSEDLRPSAFLRFLLEEERAELGSLGGEHFQDLTAGAYRFSEDGEFAVLDMNGGGAERRAESLSGGETFLASLALALALAEMVARGGGRMDAFFLDEGFGSLDPEHLDRAMEGIERLVAESEHRLVVVVSHVSAMRDAIDDLVVLDKDPTTGDTIVRAGALG